MASSHAVVVFIFTALLLSGCTATPEKYKKNSANFGRPALQVMQANNSKMQAVATASIGVPQQYVDLNSGMTNQLTVESEYFSASGRVCRRFKENVNGQSSSGVSCQDARSGWVEIPLAAVLR